MANPVVVYNAIKGATKIFKMFGSKSYWGLQPSEFNDRFKISRFFRALVYNRNGSGDDPQYQKGSRKNYWETHPEEIPDGMTVGTLYYVLFKKRWSWLENGLSKYSKLGHHFSWNPDMIDDPKYNHAGGNKNKTNDQIRKIVMEEWIPPVGFEIEPEQLTKTMSITDLTTPISMGSNFSLFSDKIVKNRRLLILFGAVLVGGSVLYFSMKGK